MREFEKYLCEYVVLGCPRRPLLFFMKFFINKGTRPTVYTEKRPFKSRVFGMARFCIAHTLSSDNVAIEILLRHARCHPAKKCVLIYTPSYTNFIERSRSKLENNFLILNSEDIYAS